MYLCIRTISLIIKNKNYEENYYNADCIAFICMC